MMLPGVDDPMGRATDVLERLREIENLYDDFTATATAANAHGIGPTMLNELEDRGLPYGRTGRGRVYSRKMLRTLALYLDIKSPEVVAMRYWLRTGARLDMYGSLDVAVSIRARMNDVDPAHVRAWRPDGADFAPTFDGEFAMAEHVVRISRRAGRPAHDGSALLADCADLRYVYLPEHLETNTDIFDRLRLANCRSFAYHADRLSRARGIESRISTGLLVALPYCTQHSWVEFGSGDEWVAVEPLLASLIAAKDARQQPEHIERRLIGLFARWGGAHTYFFQPSHLCTELKATARVVS